MDATPRLQLPYIASQQAQKQVTYNHAMRALDLLVQPAVKSRTLGTPPAAPAEGDTYVVGPAASGAWTGKEGRFASWLDGAWNFRTPQDGWLVYVADSAEIAMRQGGAWAPLVTNGGSAVAKFGINATADLVNRLTVAAPSSLFTHEGAGHRLKLNKANSAETGSLLFQTGDSGRAELGLVGDDDFRVKVSADGASWTEALSISRATGLVTLPQGQLAFPATQVPSADPHVLDDYEEGTWTPVLTANTPGNLSVSYAVQDGSYTKKGREVTLRFHIATASFTHSTATGDLLITGEPFPAAAITVGVLLYAGYSSVTYPAHLVCRLNANGTNIRAFQNASGQISTAAQIGNFPSGGQVELIGSITFFV